MNEEKKTVGAKIKAELGYMKKGAKILPKAIVAKGKGWIKGQVEIARERARMERVIEAAERKAEQEAFKKEAIKQAKIRGIRKAQKKRRGWRGALAELGEIGDSMSLGRDLGVQKPKESRRISTSDFLFGGLGQQEKKKKQLLEEFDITGVTLSKKKPKKKK